LRSMQASDLPALFAFWGLGCSRALPKASEIPRLPRGYKYALEAFAGAHRLKQFSRCHRRTSGCGRSWARSGGRARPVLLMKLRIPSASLTCRGIRMSRSSDRLIKPRVNIL